MFSSFKQNKAQSIGDTMPSMIASTAVQEIVPLVPLSMQARNTNMSVQNCNQ